MKKAIITGVTGQDGAYLSDYLLNLGYQVYGAYRRTSSSNFWRLEYLNLLKNKNFKLIELDITDQSSVFSSINEIRPDEIYNLAAQSFVGVSFKQPSLTSNVTGLSVLNFLEGIKHLKNDIKFYQASSSEMYGKVQKIPQDEETPFYPRSPYGVAKLFAHWMTINYRESYDIFASSGILFNHESPLRGIEFVTRKISDNVAKISLGLIDYFELGNLDAKRDWGHARDYVKGMHLMLQHEKPDSFVLSTGKSFSIRDFLEKNLQYANIDYFREGDGLDEVFYSRKSKKPIVKISKDFYRPAEVDFLIGDCSKASKLLGWKPEIDLDQLALEMFQADLKRNK